MGHPDNLITLLIHRRLRSLDNRVSLDLRWQYHLYSRARRRKAGWMLRDEETTCRIGSSMYKTFQLQIELTRFNVEKITHFVLWDTDI